MDPHSTPPKDTVGKALGVALLAAVYACVAWGSLSLFATLHESASPVWPPTGLAVAALLLWGLRLWPGILLGAFVANQLTQGTFATSAAIAAGNTLEAIVAWLLIRRWAGGTQAFTRAGSTLAFLVACAAAPLVSATVGVTALAMAGSVAWDAYMPVWATWYLGDTAGAMVMAPVAIILLGKRRRVQPLLHRVPEAAALAAALFLAGTLVFSPFLMPRPHMPLSFLMLPPVVWAAIRFGSAGGAAATCVAVSMAVWGTLLGHGPFAVLPTNTALLVLQLFAIVAASTALPLGAVVHERRDAKEASEKHLLSEAKFRAIVESAPDALLIADAHGRIAVVNGQAERMFGYPASEMLGQTIELLVPGRFSGKHPQHRAAYMASPKPRPMGAGVQLFARRKDGSEFPVEISLSPIDTAEGPMVSSSIRDLTGRRAVEAELEASRRQVAVTEKLAALGSMVSGVAHEVRTPLTYINTNLALTRMQMDGLVAGTVAPVAAAAQVKALVAKNQEGVARIDRIVMQLRQFSRAEPSVEPVALDEVVAAAVDLFRSVHKGQLVVESDLQAVPAFHVDRGQVQQVLINLLNNASEAMGHTGALHVRLRRSGQGAQVEVQDHGPGIPADVQRRLYDPFFTTKPEGTGLGLSISRRLIEAHGGSIGFRTGPTGTTFTVTLPGERAEAP